MLTTGRVSERFSFGKPENANRKFTNRAIICSYSLVARRQIMSGFSFQVFKTKVRGVSQKFRLEDPAERKKYFNLKAGSEIKKIQKYLKKNTFVGFLLGKKNSGKGTYTKLFMEAVGGENIAHISIGDIVRGVHQELGNRTKKKELV